MSYTLVNPRQYKPRWPGVIAAYVAGKSIEEILQACGGYLTQGQIVTALRSAGVYKPRPYTKFEAGRKGAMARWRKNGQPL